jgi:predicted nucleic acid-binding protein
LEKIREANRSYKKFLMCDFSSPEIFNVLFKEYVNKKLNSLPYRFRLKEGVISRTKFTSKERNEILDEIINFFKIFFEEKKMLFVELSLGKEIDILFDLIFIDRCHVTDAVLVSTAIDNSCEYFITQDTDIIRKLKKKKEIKAISANEFLSKFRKEIV